MRAAVVVLAVGAVGGCHIIAGFDDVELRDGSKHVWSHQYGGVEEDGEAMQTNAQMIDDVVVTPLNIRVAGTFLESIAVGDPALSTSMQDTRFIAQIDGNGNPMWSLKLEQVEHHRLVPGTTFMSFGYRSDFNLLGTDLTVNDMGAAGFAVVDLAADGTSITPVATGYVGQSDSLSSLVVVQRPRRGRPGSPRASGRPLPMSSLNDGR